MAQKRMFSNSVIGSDDFIEMPDSSQLLYFYLSMQADDDGFVDNWKSIMRMTGKKEDDLKILVAKSFVIPFDTGVIVIRHWRLNNYIQKDRYKETIHKKEKSLLKMDKNNVYDLYTECIRRLDKVRLDIDNNNIYGQNEGQNGSNDLGQKGQNELNDPGQNGQNGQNDPPNDLPEKELWEEQFEKFYAAYPKKVKKQNVKNWFKKNTPSNELFSSMMNSLEQFRASADWKKDGGQFIPYPTSWLNQNRWEDESIPQENAKKAPKANYEQREYDNLDFLIANNRGE